MVLKPIPTSKEIIKKPTDDIDNDVAKERAFVTEAVIVRNMKARKTETHPILVNLVIDQIKMFKCEPKLVKQRIEKLIEREYLKRDENDKGKLIYLP